MDVFIYAVLGLLMEIHKKKKKNPNIHVVAGLAKIFSMRMISNQTFARIQS